jgi:hypothetical protein
MSIAVLRIVLEDIDPPVARGLEAPLFLRLDRLHLALQAAVLGLARKWAPKAK